MKRENKIESIVSNLDTKGLIWIEFKAKRLLNILFKCLLIVQKKFGISI